MTYQEQETPSPLLEQLIDAVHRKDRAAIEFIMLEPGSLEVIQELAKRHWELRTAYDHTPNDEEEKKARIKENTYFSVTFELAIQNPAPTAATIRRLLNDQYGFSNDDFDEFVAPDESGDTSTIIMYFEHMAYLNENELLEARQFFTKPRNAEGFKGINIMQKLDSEMQSLMATTVGTPEFDQAFSDLDSFNFMKSRS